MVTFPREQWIADGIAPDSLPPGTDVPSALDQLFTTTLPDSVPLFATIELSADGTDLAVRLIVLGAVADSPGILYVLDPVRSEVLQFAPAVNSVRGVNTTYRDFVDFLQRINTELDRCDGDFAKALGDDLRQTLKSIDPQAFEPGNWWPMVFERLSN
ncbi:SUKH-4 family immunity protein [Glycomyces buryatensis]|uniref:SUKH-4 immunity protein of toxin-antitoxin system n=1 Tax=Glycomyces buryatensis TaxID=2570927 RepID=A0A4V4HSA2_9ACTN|nr:SUKH-4 family immunity protein [Glycomyces buryatensis]THV40936.1 hypothetical protein FAB82_13890 [Glycomyces buryatensis]